MRPDLTGLRALADGMLTDAGQVLVQTGTTVDPNSGAEIPEFTTFHDGPMLVTPTTAEARIVEAGQQAVSLRTFDVWLPADTQAPREAKVRLTSCHYDPGMVYDPDDPDTTELTVLDAPGDGLQVCRHVVAVDSSTT